MPNKQINYQPEREIKSMINNQHTDSVLNQAILGVQEFFIAVFQNRLQKLKVMALNVFDRVFPIDHCLEKVLAQEKPVSSYKVPVIKKELFGNINIDDSFFDSLKEDYPEFTQWFKKKSEQTVYICNSERGIGAFLYLKVEDENEPYYDINPTFESKKRLKIGTFKVDLNGYKLGARFIQIIFDNALRFKVDEIYVTLFNKREEQQHFIKILNDFGFKYHGTKGSQEPKELVYVRQLEEPIN